jgi:hypothetical protein
MLLAVHLLLLVISNALCPFFLFQKRMLDSFNAAFEITKPAQKLKVFPTLGMVDLELELDGRSISMQVQPIYATIIYLFEDQGKKYARILLFSHAEWTPLWILTTCFAYYRTLIGR